MCIREVGRVGRDSMRESASVAERGMSEFNGQGVASTAYAFTTAGESEEKPL